MINNQSNILSDIQRFNTIVDWKMLREEFKTQFIDTIPDTTLLILSIHITNLGYLKYRPLCVIKLPNGSIKELNFGLDYAAAIPDTNNQCLSDSSDLEAEWAKMKEEKIQRHEQKKITQIQETFFASVGAWSAAVAGSPSSAFSDNGSLSIVFSGGFLSTVFNSGPLSSIAGNFMSTIFGSSLLSDIASGSTSTIFDNGFLFLFIDNGPLSPVLSDGLLSSIADDDLLSLIASCSPLSLIAYGGPLSLVVGGGSLSLTANNVSPSDGSSAFSLSGTLTHISHSSLFPLVAPPVSSITQITGKRLFDKVFIR